MNKIEEFERDLKVAYLNYESNNLKETLKYLDRMLETILKEDESLESDPFWKTLSCDVFKAIVLNNFYNKVELTGKDLDFLLENEEELKKNLKDFCHNFRNNELINFISHIENITDNPLKEVIKILMSNIGKMNITNIKTEININNDGNNKIQKIDCFCGNSFEFDWSKIPNTEKSIYMKCPNCDSELKRGNPYYHDYHQTLDSEELIQLKNHVNEITNNGIKVNNEINNNNIIMDYLLNKLHKSNDFATKFYNDIVKYKDLEMEFVSSIKNGNYQIPNTELINVEGFNAKNLKEKTTLTELGIYNMLMELRANPKEAKRSIDTLRINKSEISQLDELINVANKLFKENQDKISLNISQINKEKINSEIETFYQGNYYTPVFNLLIFVIVTTYLYDVTPLTIKKLKETLYYIKNNSDYILNSVRNVPSGLVSFCMSYHALTDECKKMIVSSVEVILNNYDDKTLIY